MIKKEIVFINLYVKKLVERAFFQILKPDSVSD